MLFVLLCYCRAKERRSVGPRPSEEQRARARGQSSVPEPSAGNRAREQRTRTENQSRGLEPSEGRGVRERRAAAEGWAEGEGPKNRLADPERYYLSERNESPKQ